MPLSAGPADRAKGEVEQERFQEKVITTIMMFVLGIIAFALLHPAVSCHCTKRVRLRRGARHRMRSARRYSPIFPVRHRVDAAHARKPGAGTSAELAGATRKEVRFSA